MAKKPKMLRFNVAARIDVVTDVEIGAASWEQAIEKARALKLEQFVTLKGSYIDGDGLSLDSIYRMKD